MNIFIIKTFLSYFYLFVLNGEEQKFSKWAKGERLQKSLEGSESDTHSLVNNWSNLKKEIRQKCKLGLSNT